MKKRIYLLYILLLFFIGINMTHAATTIINMSGSKLLSDGKSTQTIKGDYGTTGTVGMTTTQQIIASISKGKASCTYLTSVFTKVKPIVISWWQSSGYELKKCKELDLDGDGNIEVVYTIYTYLHQGSAYNTDTYNTYIMAPASPNIILTNGTDQQFSGMFEIKNINGRNIIFLRSPTKYSSTLTYNVSTHKLLIQPFVYDYPINNITIANKNYLLATDSNYIGFYARWGYTLKTSYYILNQQYTRLSSFGNKYTYGNWGSKSYQKLNYWGKSQLGTFGTTISNRLGHSHWLLAEANHGNSLTIDIVDIENNIHYNLITKQSFSQHNIYWQWINGNLINIKTDYYYYNIKIADTSGNKLLLFSTNENNSTVNSSNGGLILIDGSTFKPSNLGSLSYTFYKDQSPNTGAYASIQDMTNHKILNTGGTSFSYDKRNHVITTIGQYIPIGGAGYNPDVLHLTDFKNTSYQYINQGNILYLKVVSAIDRGRGSYNKTSTTTWYDASYNSPLGMFSFPPYSQGIVGGSSQGVYFTSRRIPAVTKQF